MYINVYIYIFIYIYNSVGRRRYDVGLLSMAGFGRPPMVGGRSVVECGTFTARTICMGYRQLYNSSGLILTI